MEEQLAWGRGAAVEEDGFSPSRVSGERERKGLSTLLFSIFLIVIYTYRKLQGVQLPSRPLI